MQLSYRLKTVAELVNTGGAVADIGCDHAYVSIYLIQNNLAAKVIAMDVNKGPLEKAKENINHYGLEAVIETRLSDGAGELVEGEADTLLIGGMGGALTIKILSQSEAVVLACRQLVLQPQSEIHLVRKYLRKIGFVIEKEKMLIDDGKYYVAMRAVKSDELFEGRELFDRYGKYLLEEKAPVLQQYLSRGYEQTVELLCKLETSSSPKAEQRMNQLREDLEYIKEGLSYYEM